MRASAWGAVKGDASTWAIWLSPRAAFIIVNSSTIQDYYKYATINPLTYWFSGSKTILVNQACYRVLAESAAIDSKIPANIADMNAVEKNFVLAWQDHVLISVRRMKDGVK